MQIEKRCSKRIRDRSQDNMEVFCSAASILLLFALLCMILHSFSFYFHCCTVFTRAVARIALLGHFDSSYRQSYIPLGASRGGLKPLFPQDLWW